MPVVKKCLAKLLPLFILPCGILTMRQTLCKKAQFFSVNCEHNNMYRKARNCDSYNQKSLGDLANILREAREEI